MHILNTELVDQTKLHLKRLNQTYIISLVIGGALLVPILGMILSNMFVITILVGLLIYLYFEVKKHYKDKFLLSGVWLSLCVIVLNISQIKIIQGQSSDENLLPIVIYLLIGGIAYFSVAISYCLLIKSYLDYRSECRQFEQMLQTPMNQIATQIKPAMVNATYKQDVQKYTTIQLLSFMIRALLVIAIYFTVMNVDVITAIVAIPFQLIMSAVFQFIHLSKEAQTPFLQAWANVYLQSIFFFSFFGLFFNEIRSGIKKLNWSTFSLIFIGYGLSLVSVILVNIVLRIFGLSIPESENQKTIELIQQVAPVPMIITAVLLAPITEELVFRQGIAEVVYRFSDMLFKSVNMSRVKDVMVILSVVVSGVLFGFIHVMGNGDYIAMIPYAVSGIVYTIFYFISGRNVMVTIGAHMLNNLIATIMTF